MRPYDANEKLSTIITTAIPAMSQAEYPVFVSFIQAFVRYLEDARVVANTTAASVYAANGIADITETLSYGGGYYESQHLLNYRDISTTLDEFVSHFLAGYGRDIPQQTRITSEQLLHSLREFYNRKGSNESLTWLFRILFNKSIELYYPRDDVFRASDATWYAPQTIKVSVPNDQSSNELVSLYYTGQRISTDTASAIVERVVSVTVGSNYGDATVINELTLVTDSILGTFYPEQIITNEGTLVVPTTILGVISDIIVESGGSNYAVGDIVNISEGPTGGGGFEADAEVSAVGSTSLNAITVIDGGDGFMKGQYVNFISSTGSGANAVIESIRAGHITTESGAYIIAEQSGSNIEIEDKNTILLGLSIEPFVNSSANIALNVVDYGAAAGVTQLANINLESSISSALAAADEKPFMTPWVFLDDEETIATLANVGLILSNEISYSGNTSFFIIDNVYDANTTYANSTITFDSIKYETGVKHLYIVNISNTDILTINLALKSANGNTKTGTVTTNGNTTLTGNGTLFSTECSVGSHVTLGSGTQCVIESITNNTIMTATANVIAAVANTFDVHAVANITSTLWQSQRFYGEISSIRLISAGSNYKLPPIVTVDSASSRAQELFYFEPSNSSVVPLSSNVVNIFEPPTLLAQQESGQITKVKVMHSGVNYTQANDINIEAVHGEGRIGSNAALRAVISAKTQYPGEFTTNRSFASAGKCFQDEDFFNDYTYVIRVAETFSRYKDIVKKLLHPAGFNLRAEYVEVFDAPLTLLQTDVDITVS